MENRQDIRVERLEKLKQATIINYTDIVDFNDKVMLYETIIQHVLNGDYDDIFVTGSVSEAEDKNEAFALARKYSSLCFYQGNSEYWLDSIEGVSLSNLELICLKILDNYDFLVRIAGEGGEAALKELLKFQQNHAFDDYPVIEHLRNTFMDDTVLENTIIEMSKTEGLYDCFTDKQKIELCSYPEGALYRVDESGKYTKITAIDVKKKMREYLLGEDDELFDDSDLKKLLSTLSSDDFTEILDGFVRDYQLEGVEQVTK